MSDLTTFRDHCRLMALGGPRPPKTATPPCRYPGWMGLDHQHCREGWQGCSCDCHERPSPPTDSDRALWQRMADEIDEHLAPVDEPLFGGDA